MNRPTVQGVRNIWADLVKARDEARLQLHLLSNDAKDRWDPLEKRLESLEARVLAEGEHLAEQTVEKLLEAREGVEAFVFDHLPPSGILAEYAGDIMTEVTHACRPDAPLRDAAAMMWKHDCGLVFVTDPEDKLLGVVTDRDVCMAAFTQGLSLETATVESAMTKEVRTCGPEQLIADVLEAMETGQVRRIPITSVETGRLIGVVSLADIAQRLYDLSKTTAGRQLAFNRLARAVAAVTRPRAD